MNTKKLLLLLALLLCLGSAGCNQQFPVNQLPNGIGTIDQNSVYADEKGRLWLVQDAPAQTFSQSGLLVQKTKTGYGISVEYLERNKTPYSWSLTPKVYDSFIKLVPVVHFSGSKTTEEQWRNLDGHLLLPPALETAASLKLRSQHGKLVSEMNVDECSWASPEAMYADEQGQLSLQSSYFVYDRPGGKGEIQIMRLETGYAVDVSKAPDARWKRGEHFEDSKPETVTDLLGADTALVRRSRQGNALLPAAITQK